MITLENMYRIPLFLLSLIVTLIVTSNRPLYGNAYNSTSPFVDIPCWHWGIDALWWAKNRGLITGLPNGRLPAGENPTRVNAISIFVRTVWGDDVNSYMCKGIPCKDVESPFEDAKDKKGEWWYPYVHKAYYEGSVTGRLGEDGKWYLDPYEPAMREQVVAWIVRNKFGENFNYIQNKYFSDSSPDYWAFKYVQKGFEEWLVRGSDCGHWQRCFWFRPVTIEELIFILYNAYGG